MTIDRERHPDYEELISASLRGDLTADERRRLDAHLDSCPTCRATLAAFSDQRRIMAGLRHIPVPRDLGARVRTGIDRRDAGRRWWQRPPAIFAGVGGGLAVVTGVLLALVLIGNPDDPEVGEASPTPFAPSVSATAIPTLPPLETPAPTEPPASVAPSPSVEPAPTATPVEASPEPDGYLAVTGPFDNRAMTVVDVATGDPLQEVETPPGVPIAAELSPDGQWLAYIVEMGLSGFTEVRATRISEGIPSDDPAAPPLVDSPVAIGETVTLAESTAGSPFVEHLFWSPHSRYLAFTVVDRDAGGTDVWIFEPGRGEASRATDTGTAYAGSWVPGDSGTSLLWISTAGETPESHLWMINDDAGEITPRDPRDSPYPAATDVFQPIVSPDGALVIFWTGRMERSDDEWSFVQAGFPWVAENRQAGERGYEFDENQPLFTDVTIDRDAFTWAAIRWSPDSNAFAVWDAAWTGISHGTDEEYPDPARVYLGRAFDPAHVTRIHALDVGDLPEDASVVDVKVAGTGRHLAITARRPLPGDLSPPEAVLLLVARNTGRVSDEVVTLAGREGQWYGPAVFSAVDWSELIGD
ncbi:MAG TPA: zf-HC2 domain-containing protein [Candidatus Limnocylindria bacterium]